VRSVTVGTSVFAARLQQITRKLLNSSSAWASIRLASTRLAWRLPSRSSARQNNRRLEPEFRSIAIFKAFRTDDKDLHLNGRDKKRLNLTPPVQERFFSALQAAGLPEVPGEFSVVAWHQVVPNATLAEIGKFIRAFDQVTARSAWQTAACRNVPAIAQLRRSEVCFFSAWDFHLPPDGGFKLIEFNDNGSGFLFGAIINSLYHDAAGLRRERRIAAPRCLRLFQEHIGNLVEQEAKSFFGELLADVFLILDDAASLDHGKFRKEHWLLRDLFQKCG
jgi:hypothetical protein